MKSKEHGESLGDGHTEQRASEKHKRISELEMTLEYHKSIGSSPPHILRDNPGMRRSDLMTDEEILEYLKDLNAGIKRFEDIIEGDPSAENSAIGDFLRHRQENQKLTIEYLTRIGRLPSN